MGHAIMKQKSGCLRRATSWMTRRMEDFFCRLGWLFGRFPLTTVIAVLLTTVILGSGLIFWQEETDDLNLWTTDESPVRRHGLWVREHFSDQVRYESIIVSADNVLRPDVIRFVWELDQSVRNISARGKGWHDVCARYGTALKKHLRRRRNTEESLFTDTEFNPEIDLSDIDFSDVFGDENDSQHTLIDALGDNALELLSMPDECLYQSIVRLWDAEDIYNLTQERIIADVTEALNETRNSEWNSAAKLLSNIAYDDNNNAIGAEATLLLWLLDNSSENKSSYEAWEHEFIQQTVLSNKTLPPGVELFALAFNSYDDALEATISSNIKVLLSGFSLIILYVGVMLGRFNAGQQRFLLSIVGVSVVGLAIVASFGLCFYFGFIYGPVHPILPFLLLGIGVDDMFVIIQALDNLTDEERRRNIPERMGLTLKHAGVSITVTSVTDIVAFGIGATTTMPALRSFCVYATMGILCLFIFEISFFVALTALDEKRRDSRRDACCFRILPSTWEPSTCSRTELLKVVFQRFYGKWLLKTPVKIGVTLITVVFVAVNLWGLLQLEQDFDPNWYLKEGSYPRQYYSALKQYFPENGELSAVYTGKLAYHRQTEELNQLSLLLKTNPFIKSSSVMCWHDAFQDWLKVNKPEETETMDERSFKLGLQHFLFSPQGRKYLQDIKIQGSLLDTNANFNITATRIRFQHVSMASSDIKNRALDFMFSLESSVTFEPGSQPTHPMPFTIIYVEWEANKVISNELVRNLGLTMAAVASVTLILISDLVTVFWVFTCVAFTLIDVLGIMYFWGLTIEIVTSIIIILSVGLAVDYAAHIGHTFTTVYGSKSDRAHETLSRMGPAVWNGGFSTFLAFVLLANSDSYVFTTFFKLFFSVVVFGLFHGLAYLPVVLSWLGPAPHLPEEDDSEKTDSSIADSSNGSSKSKFLHIYEHHKQPVLSRVMRVYAVSEYGYINTQFLYDQHDPRHKQITPAPRKDNGMDSNKVSKATDAKKPPQTGRNAKSETNSMTHQQPYIPAPDYTPLPPRKMQLSPYLAIPQSNASVPWHQDRETYPEWQVPPTSSPLPRRAGSPFSSQFDAMLMKRLSIEAQRRQHQMAERALESQVNFELSRFEDDMDSYLGSEEIDPSSASDQSPQKAASTSGATETSGSVDSPRAASTPETLTPTCGSSTQGSNSPVAPRSPASSSCSETRGQNTRLPKSKMGACAHVEKLEGEADRDRESLESGYMSSYVNRRVRRNVSSS